MKFLASRNSYPLVNIKLVDKSNNSYVVAARNYSLLGTDANCELPKLAPNYIDNLERLGLVHVDANARLKDDDLYKRIEDSDFSKELVSLLDNYDGKKSGIGRVKLDVTDFGKQFIKSCVVDKEFQKRG